MQMKHIGSCHCGDVRFEVEIDATNGSRCNCSVCNKIGATTGITKPAAFVLLTDQARLSTYEWGGKTAQRYFCTRCGVHCFARGHLAQLGGDYVSVNFNCIDDLDLRDVAVKHWDGRNNNWQAGARETPWPLSR
jgi:hypothetical protein